jgi:hypothetical protein
MVKLYSLENNGNIIPPVLTFKTLNFSTKSVFFSEETVINSLNSKGKNLSKRCVFCEVGTKFLYIIKTKFLHMRIKRYKPHVGN